ncbi:MAG: shikimate dehydrogenase [Lentimonas sp.]
MTTFDTARTYTLNDLGKTDFGGTPLAVLGHPIKHSVSPAMHNAALAKMREVNSRFKDWTYFRFDVAPEDLPEALSLFHQHNFLGLNLTIPHKVQALDLIKGISPDAERMGAVNTLVWNEFGYNGFNTDGYGIKSALQHDLGVSLKGRVVVLLGSGGAARAAAVQCVLDGCAKLYIGNRTPERLQSVMEVVHAMPNGATAEAFAIAELPQDLPNDGVVINATSLGLKVDDAAPINVTLLPAGWKVYDMIYNPSQTTLLKEAQAHGLMCQNGLSMLVYQGVRSLEIWSHAEVDSHVMMTAALHALDLPPRYD